MTREEILNLSKMEEIEQYKVLDDAGVLQYKPYGTSKTISCCHVESLADCAERLWRETVQSAKIVDAMSEIEQMIGPECYADAEEGEHESWYWWAFCALPIHRIQAALLAKEK